MSGEVVELNCVTRLDLPPGSAVAARLRAEGGVNIYRKNGVGMSLVKEPSRELKALAAEVIREHARHVFPPGQGRWVYFTDLRLAPDVYALLMPDRACDLS